MEWLSDWFHNLLLSLHILNILWFDRASLFNENMSKACGNNLTSIGESLEVGTRIHWDDKTQTAIYVDVPTSMVYKYDPASGNVTSAKVGDEPLAFMFPVEGSDTKYIAGLGKKFVSVEWDGVSPNVSCVNTIAEVDDEEHLKNNRLNGAKVDPQGRLWAGTMGPSGPDGLSEPGKGSLFSMCKGVVTKHICEVGVSNGLAWDTNSNKMYFIDTLVPGVYEFDFDPETASISNRKIVFEFKPNNIEGKPDGLTIDSDGNLWVCVIYGSEIVNFNPKDGKTLKRVKFPTPEITAITFAGQNLDKLFVTTAKIPIDGNVPVEPAGKTFVVANTCGARGLPSNRYIEK